MLSFDIFNYIFTAKVSYLYKENPYIIMPIEFVGDPYLSFTHASNKIALYGPFWILLTYFPYILGLGSFIMTMYAMKILPIAGYILIMILLSKMSKTRLSVLLFCLNPLVIIETLISSHNDIVMMALALLSLYLFSKNRFLLASISLFLSILIKYATVFLLPVYCYMLFKQYKGEKISQKYLYLACALSMFLIFLLSPLREEMYPWYAIWFLPFVFLIDYKVLSLLSIGLTFGLLLRYVPFMYSGTHSGFTPLIRIIVTIFPSFLVLVLLVLSKIKWVKRFYQY